MTSLICYILVFVYSFYVGINFSKIKVNKPKAKDIEIFGEALFEPLKLVKIAFNFVKEKLNSY